MIRNVSARLELEIQGHTNIVLSVAAAQREQLSAERLDISLDGRSIVPEELVDRLGSRLHEFRGDPGRMTIDYSAEITGQAPLAPIDPMDLIVYLRPSRYCESDSLLPTARMAAVYAPGLSPMDFHAVAEAYVDGRWQVVDATGLAPRQSLVRISTGRDAADTAFLTNHWADLILLDLQVLAIVDYLPMDDHTGLVTLG